MPKALRDTFQGRVEIKHSLRTRDLREALLQARQLSLAAYELFAMVKRAMVRPFDPNDLSTWPTAGDVAGKFEMTVEEDIATGKRITRIKTDPDSPASVAAGKEVALAISAQRSRDRSPEDIVRSEAERNALEVFLPPPGAEVQNTSRRPVDPAKLSAHERTRLLSVVWSNYSAERAGSKWNSRTVSDYNQKFEEFLGWIGDRVIGTVTKEDYSSFKNWLRTEYRPPKAKAAVKPGIDVRSIDKYTTAINGLFVWAQNSGFFPEKQTPPTAKQSIMTKNDVKKRARKRIANRDFRPEELAVVFDPVAYVKENQVPHHFWCPLIALFSGVRRAEVAQLLLRDIRKDENGLWVIDIADDDLIKHIKNDSARRTIPIHPVLIEIGLLDYHREVAEGKKGPELFPGIQANKHGEKGNAVGNAWRRYLIRRGVRTEGQNEDDPDTLTFHSLRHTAVSLLRKKGLPYDLRCQMVGHEAEGQHAQYGEMAPAKVLADEVLPKFQYPNLNLSELIYRKGSSGIRKKINARRMIEKIKAD